MFKNKICIKDSIKQIDSFWILREQIFIPNNLFGIYFDDNDKLLVNKDKVTYLYTFSNSCTSRCMLTISNTGPISSRYRYHLKKKK